MKKAKAKNTASKKYYISEKQLERIKQKVSKEITDKWKMSESQLKKALAFS